MKTLINPIRFIKALEYASAKYFSKPYSLTTSVDRWFNQLAMIELANGQLLRLSRQLATEHVDIILDGAVVDKKDIQLIMAFHSQHSTHEKLKEFLMQPGEGEKERQKIVAGLKEINANLARSGETEESTQLNAKEKSKLEEQLKLFDNNIILLGDTLEKFEANQLKTATLYEAIVARGQSSLNIKSLEKAYESKVTNIVHRPNHGITHSARAAYAVTALRSYGEKYKQESSALYANLDDSTLEKLQLMMLFSVVGRRDETGFNDDNGHSTYESFRTASGRAYLEYCRTHALHLYPDSNLEQLYRDAIIVELMGYDSIGNAEECKKVPELLIDYVIEKEGVISPIVDREKALSLIISKKYSPTDWTEPGKKGPKKGVKKGPKTHQGLFPSKTTLPIANAMLEMMNDAHGIDLTRCYSLYPQKVDGSESIAVLDYHLQQTDFLNFTDKPDLKKLTDFFKLMRCSFDTMAVTGQKTTFGLLSTEAFEEQKDELLTQVKAISDRFKARDKKELLDEAKKSNAADVKDSYFNSDEKDEQALLKSYRAHLITHAIAEKLKQGQQLSSDKAMFHFQHVINGNLSHIDHHKNAVSLVSALQAVTPIPEVEPNTLPMISAVKHHSEQNTVSVYFDNNQQGLFFKNSFDAMFAANLLISPTLDGSFVVEVNRQQYKQLLSDHLIQFKEVTIPEGVTREETLVDDNGKIDALNLVERSRALVRLVSTSDLGNHNHPDYEFLFNALEDPVRKRYVAPLKENDSSKIERTQYWTPDGAGAPQIRTLVNTPDIRFQEPITEPKKMSDKTQDSWAIGTDRTAAKNTIFTKKLAHSLLPPNGQSIPFSGYLKSATNYFPIGILSDIRQVDLKDERYIWSKNIASRTKFWIRDDSIMNKQLYSHLNAKLDLDDKLSHNAQGQPTTKDLPVFQHHQALVGYYADKAKRITNLLDNPYYRPSTEVLNNCLSLAKSQQTSLLKTLRGIEPEQTQVKETFKQIKTRIKAELSRKSFKYSITLRELIKQQQSTTDVMAHNEILAANTKGATRALYAVKDELFDRLNLAVHAMKIREKYHYDIPLLIMSRDKSPYHYSEEMIKADLLSAYHLMRENKFPYDKSFHPVYEQDAEGHFVVKKNHRGKDVNEPKNLGYQRDLLLELFRIGIPKLTSIQQLAAGKIGKVDIDEALLNTSVASILERMDTIGGLKRETQRMQLIFSTSDHVKKESFFLRTVALGHMTLMEAMIANKDFNLTDDVLVKAIQFADINHHPDVKNTLMALQKERIEASSSAQENDNNDAIQASVSEVIQDVGLMSAEKPVPAEEQLALVLPPSLRTDYLNTQKPVATATTQPTVLTLINQYKGHEKRTTDLTCFMQSLQTLSSGQATELLLMNKVRGHIQLIRLDIQELLKNPGETVTTLLSYMKQDGWEPQSTVILPCRPAQAQAIQAIAALGIEKQMSVYPLILLGMQAEQNPSLLSSKVKRLTGKDLLPLAPLSIEQPVSINNSQLQQRYAFSQLSTLIEMIYNQIDTAETRQENDNNDAIPALPVDDSEVIQDVDLSAEKPVPAELEAQKKQLSDELGKIIKTLCEKALQIRTKPTFILWRPDEKELEPAIAAIDALRTELSDLKDKLNNDNYTSTLTACLTALDNKDRKALFEQKREAPWFKVITGAITTCKALLYKMLGQPMPPPTDTAQKVASFKDNLTQMKINDESTPSGHLKPVQSSTGENT